MGTARARGGGYSACIKQLQSAVKSDLVTGETPTSGIRRIGEAAVIGEHHPAWS